MIVWSAQHLINNHSLIITPRVEVPDGCMASASLYLPISPRISRVDVLGASLSLPHISPISPPYLPHISRISPVSPPYLPGGGAVARSGGQLGQLGDQLGVACSQRAGVKRRKRV